MRSKASYGLTAFLMVLVAAVSAVVIPQVANAGVSGSVGNGPMVFQSGEYTPTITGVSNVVSTSSWPAQWSRVGDVVTVSGLVGIQVAATSDTLTQFQLSLPVASNFTTVNDLNGNGHIDDAYSSSPPVGGLADTAADKSIWFYYSNAANTTDVFYTRYNLQYRVK